MMVNLAGNLVERKGMGDLLAAPEAIALEDGRMAGGEAFAGEIGDSHLRNACIKELVDWQAEG